MSPRQGSMYNSGVPPSRARSPDSWVEIPSRPSATSLRSASDASPPPSPTILNDATIRRRGRISTASPLHLELPPRPSSVGGSSQEEYEESESESDRVMTSSNEGLPSSSSESGSRPRTSGAEDAGEDEDETRTALGVPTESNCFTPQPNVFSHPPSSQTQSRSRNSVPGSYFPSTSRSTTGQRHSFPSQRPRQGHSPYNALSPNHQPDHDAALRASLTTLLSLGAAARGLPKKSSSQPQSRTTAQPSTARVDTTTLRTVPESVALGLDRPSLPPRRTSSTPSSSDRNSSPAFKYLDPNAQTTSTAQPSSSSDRPKRKAQRSSSKDRERQRVAKKPRRMIIEEGVSPTLLTWVVSAGVLVLVSALSFSAGYKVGKETARFDAGLGVGEGEGCAKEAGRTGMGLRRLRWGGAAASAVSA